MDTGEHQLLLRQAMAGDRGAFKALIDAHRLKLMACIKARLGAAQSHADDVFQEATLAAWQSLLRCQQEPPRFEAWLLGIARNKAIDKLRQLERQLDLARGRNAGGASSAPGMSQFPADQTSPSSVERNALLDQALQQLNERQRMAIEWHVLKKLSNAKTAEEMSLCLRTTITEGQVKNYVRQGLKRLLELLPRESALFTDVATKAEK
ncbi:MAG TPA: RNA polymerase sigma factor [Gemmataceae bacterium]|jgi:RNA polymerase sigma-70 factor (ECF subfamily)